MNAYNLLSIVADIRIHELDHETVKQPTINYNQFAELLDKNEMVRSSHKTTVPSYLVKSAQLIGQKYGKSIGDKVLADLVKAYKLGLVNSRTLSLRTQARTGRYRHTDEAGPGAGEIHPPTRCGSRIKRPEPIP